VSGPATRRAWYEANKVRLDAEAAAAAEAAVERRRKAEEEAAARVRNAAAEAAKVGRCRFTSSWAPRLDRTCFRRFTLKYEEPLLNVALNVNPRPST